ncbi:MAG: CBS domain-containing protein, partial [Chloroflexota bacterium]
QHGRDIEIMQGVFVEEAMQTPPPIIAEDASLQELRRAFHEQDARGLSVVNSDGVIVGIVTLGDLQRAYETVRQMDDVVSTDLTVGEICTSEPITIGPTATLWMAARQMGERDIGRLPVIDRNSKPVGMLRRHDLVKAYNLAISRKFHDQHYAEQIRLNTLTGAHVIEYEVEKQCAIVGRMISEVDWPTEAVIASVTRHGKLIIPHGNTVLLPHDRVTVVTDLMSETVLEDLFGETVHHNLRHLR